MLGFIPRNVSIGLPRVVPGGLVVTRTFGDLDAKRMELGGLPDTITAIPDVFIYELDDDIPFIVLARYVILLDFYSSCSIMILFPSSSLPPPKKSFLHFSKVIKGS